MEERDREREGGRERVRESKTKEGIEKWTMNRGGEKSLG